MVVSHTTAAVLREKREHDERVEMIRKLDDPAVRHFILEIVADALHEISGHSLLRDRRAS
jgi:hypothetical protein